MIWSPLALERVADIAIWIAQQQPTAAARTVEELFGAAERLVQFPQSGRQVPEFERPNLREIVHRQYRIVYRIATDHIAILTVRHSLQLMGSDDLGDESVV